MEQEVKMPVPLSAFIRKRDAEYDGDPNGDYVYAEDVNELQESIERLERIIRIDSLKGSVLDELDKKADKAVISDFGSPLFIQYNGSSLNAYETVEERISAFAYLPRVMLKKETSTNFDTFINELKRSGSKLYGIVNCPALTHTQRLAEIDWFKTKGFDGISFTDFGFENGLTRAEQNQLITAARKNLMSVIVSGEIETTLFNKPHINNPQQEKLNLQTGDSYMAKNAFVADGMKNNPLVISSIAFSFNKAQKELGIQVLVEDTANFDGTASALYLYGKMLATLYNLDGYSLAPRSRYTLNERVERFLHGFELGQWKTDSPVYVEDEYGTSRRFAKGTLVFNKVKNTAYLEGVGLTPTLYTWEDKSIPGSAIDLQTADFKDQALTNLITAINEGEELIHFSKIEGLGDGGMTPDMMKDSVVRAINNSPAAYLANPGVGYDALAENDFIHGGVIDYIDAGAIKSGTLDIEHIKSNIVEAVNAYIGTAVIDKAFIGELSAEHITASVIDAINLYSENAVIGQAYIDNGVIGELTAGHIKGSVVDAINLYAGEATIDSARIGELDADKITTNVIEAINAAIGDATIDSAKIGTLEAHHISGMVVDAIKLYAGDAKIESAQIGQLSAENISAGIVEALEISASKAEFDTLKAAVISAINASLEHAFIDGAIIGEGSIDSAQIADGSITDAKIVELVANKIISGTIDTSKVTLQGDNGHLRISGNKLQVFDDQEVPVERVSIGDVDGDGNIFGMRIRGEDGVTVLYDEKGVYSEGITDGAITNPKIAEDAVDGGKHIHANTITGDKMVVEAITAREIKAKSITANEIMANTITAGSGIIAEAAIGEAEIAKASINDGHIQKLSATKITAGTMEMTSRNMVANATFKKGVIDWSFDAGFAISELSDVVKMSTTRSLHLFTTGLATEQNLGAYTEFNGAAAGEQFAGSVYALTKDIFSYDGTGPTVALEFYNENLFILRESASVTLEENDVWQRISVIATAPAGTTQVRLKISHGQNGDTFFCRPMFQKGSIVTEWTGDGSYLSDDGIYTGELHADQITAGRIKAENIQIGGNTEFAPGYSPSELREEMEDRIPYRVEVLSTNGVMFKKGQISTTLTARIYRGTDDLTDSIEAARFNWMRVGMDGEQDLEWNAAHKGMKTVDITRTDVLQRATFLCEVLE